MMKNKQIFGTNPLKIIGLALAFYGFLVLAEPTKYATWFPFPNFFGLLGIGLTLGGMVLVFRG